MARIKNYILNYTKIETIILNVIFHNITLLAIFYFNYKCSLGEQDFFQVYTHTHTPQELESNRISHQWNSSQKNS